MIKLFFSIRNPFWKKDDFKNFLTKHRQLTRNKHCEFELYTYNWNLLEIDLSLSLKGEDHAGLKFCFGFLRYYVSFIIYDSRHWDREKNDWHSYDGSGS